MYAQATLAAGKAKPHLYDAARKALVAVGLHVGDRATNRTGAHQVRNRSEYGSQIIGEQMLTTDLEHAREIVAAVEAALPERPQT